MEKQTNKQTKWA
jgi:hypothetical protein